VGEAPAKACWSPGSAAASAIEPDPPIAHDAASHAMPKRAARILIGIAYIARFMTEIRCHCYGFYYAAILTVRRGN
jgi:hypothetical protein